MSVHPHTKRARKDLERARHWLAVRRQALAKAESAVADEEEKVRRCEYDLMVQIAADESSTS